MMDIHGMRILLEELLKECAELQELAAWEGTISQEEIARLNEDRTNKYRARFNEALKNSFLGDVWLFQHGDITFEELKRRHPSVRLVE